MVALCELESCLANSVLTLHKHSASQNHVHGMVMQRAYSPPDVVWSYLSKFSRPQCWRSLVLHSEQVYGDVDDTQVGHMRKVTYISGLPGTWDQEMLHTFDEKRGLFGYTVFDGDFNMNAYDNKQIVFFR
eukprot:jgi/Mesen1/891/ME000115S00012